MKGEHMELVESDFTSSRSLKLCAGVVLAMPAGAACAYSLGDFERIWVGAVIGAVVGIVIGAITPSSITGTMAGVFVAVLTGLFMLVKGAGLWGIGGIIVGFLLGGMLERADDEWKRQNKSAAMKFCLLAALISLLLVYGFDRAAFAPEPREAEQIVVEAFSDKWSAEEPMSGFRVNSAQLERTSRTQYRGTLHVSYEDEEFPLPIDVRIDRKRDVENRVKGEIDEDAFEKMIGSLQSLPESE